MCLYPTLIKNRKYTKNKKNGGVIPTVTDLRTEYVPIGCGKCMECRKQNARQWQARLLEDIKENKNGKFITLTFNNNAITQLIEETIKKTNKQTGAIEHIKIKDLKGYERDNQIATKAVRLFVERWRKEYKKSIRHWLVTELGHKGTENIHLHGIVWTNEQMTEVERIWKYGYVWKGYQKNGQIINYVNAKTVNYIIKYISKTDIQHKEYKSKVLTSAGIGSNYLKSYNSKLNKFNNNLTDETYKTATGHIINLPIYWRNKLYTEAEKERLWINKLDKEERWVCGEQIDISKTDENYKKILQHYRQLNAQLGYGAITNENRKEYEEARREIMYATRIKRR